MYDPTLGRFLQEDPIGVASGDANFYRYCGNSPLSAVDPSGLAAGSPLAITCQMLVDVGTDPGRPGNLAGQGTASAADYGDLVFRADELPVSIDIGLVSSKTLEKPKPLYPPEFPPDRSPGVKPAKPIAPERDLPPAVEGNYHLFRRWWWGEALVPRPTWNPNTQQWEAQRSLEFPRVSDADARVTKQVTKYGTLFYLEITWPGPPKRTDHYHWNAKGGQDGKGGWESDETNPFK
jgi:hypothetical protein